MIVLIPRAAGSGRRCPRGRAGRKAADTRASLTARSTRRRGRTGRQVEERAGDSGHRNGAYGGHLVGGEGQLVNADSRRGAACGRTVTSKTSEDRSPRVRPCRAVAQHRVAARGETAAITAHPGQDAVANGIDAAAGPCNRPRDTLFRCRRLSTPGLEELPPRNHAVLTLSNRCDELIDVAERAGAYRSPDDPQVWPWAYFRVQKRTGVISASRIPTLLLPVLESLLPVSGVFRSNAAPGRPGPPRPAPAAALAGRRRRIRHVAPAKA